MANTAARRLRANPTDCERMLWRHPRRRQLGVRFRRQVPLRGAIVDFACFSPRLVIELDGGQHAWRAAEDRARTARLDRDGFRVLRFWNHEVTDNLDGVLAVIQGELTRLRAQPRASSGPPPA